MPRRVTRRRRSSSLRAFCLVGSTGTVAGTEYVKTQSYIGKDFFSQWSFWTGPDPANGHVEYVDSPTAMMMGLANATADRIYLGAEMRMVMGSGGRRSVRIQSHTVYNAGLFVVRLDHVPTGCGTWPALWMYGEDATHVWPKWGEYDIIEGVHTIDHVITSLHTTPHCDQSAIVGRDLAIRWRQGQSGGPADSCSVVAPDQYHNQGCSQRGVDGSAGAGFNARGGGTYAAEWDPMSQYFRTWFWPAGAEPVDVAIGMPQPETWGVPYSFFSLEPQVCSPRHFANMRLVIDLTFCGDLGGPTLAQYCPDVAARMTCEDFVANHPEAMTEAYWSLRKLDVYQQRRTLYTPVALVPVQRNSPPEPQGSFLGTLGYILLFLILAMVMAVYALVWRKVNLQPGGVLGDFFGDRRRLRSPLDYDEGAVHGSEDLLSLLFNGGSWTSRIVPAAASAPPEEAPEVHPQAMQHAQFQKAVLVQPHKGFR